MFLLAQVTVTLKGSQDWAIIDEVNTLGLRGETSINKDYVDKAMDLKVDVTVNAGQGKAVSFPVALRTLGLVPIEVRAQSKTKADAVRRSLLVEVNMEKLGGMFFGITKINTGILRFNSHCNLEMLALLYRQSLKKFIAKSNHHHHLIVIIIIIITIMV